MDQKEGLCGYISLFFALQYRGYSQEFIVIVITQHIKHTQHQADTGETGTNDRQAHTEQAAQRHLTHIPLVKYKVMFNTFSELHDDFQINAPL